MSGRMGCAEQYSAVLHWRGGGRVFTPLPRLTGAEWGRTLNDVSQGKATIAKRAMSPDCCQALGQIEPWVHELSLYRDDALVWQGPVRRPVESRNAFTIEAVDVLGWLDHVINTWRLTYVAASGSDGPGVPPANGRYKRPVTQIAENIIRLNVQESSLSVPPDWAGIMDYIVRRDPAVDVRFEKDGSSNTGIWNEYVLRILDELTKKGLQYTTVGRSIVLLGPTGTSTLPVAALTLEHIAGDVELVKDGTGAATLAFATNQQENNITGGATVIVGDTGTPYGRLDVLSKLQTDQDASSAEITDELEQAARQALAGRNPAPVAISLPDGAHLAPDAPVQVAELVCGQRLDVITAGFCTELRQPFLLTDVSGAWQDGNEQVAVSLTPLADPYGQPLPGDETSA